MDPGPFIAANTGVAVPPLVPEIRLHLASEITPLWEATEQALARHGLPPPYWAFAWPGSQALARHLLDHPGLVAGQRVFDFAAGSGLAAIAAAKAGAAAVEANDVDPWAGTAIALNAALNAVDLVVSRADRVGDRLEGVSLILAGDVCYERPMAERILPWLGGLAAAGRTVLLADPGRAYLPAEDGLEEIARYRVATTRELEDREERVTRVLRLVG